MKTRSLLCETPGQRRSNDGGVDQLGAAGAAGDGDGRRVHGTRAGTQRRPGGAGMYGPAPSPVCRCRGSSFCFASINARNAHSLGTHPHLTVPHPHTPQLNCRQPAAPRPSRCWSATSPASLPPPSWRCAARTTRLGASDARACSRRAVGCDQSQPHPLETPPPHPRCPCPCRLEGERAGAALQQEAMARLLTQVAGVVGWVRQGHDAAAHGLPPPPVPPSLAPLEATLAAAAAATATGGGGGGPSTAAAAAPGSGAEPPYAAAMRNLRATLSTLQEAAAESSTAAEAPAPSPAPPAPAPVPRQASPAAPRPRPRSRSRSRSPSRRRDRRSASPDRRRDEGSRWRRDDNPHEWRRDDDRRWERRDADDDRRAADSRRRDDRDRHYHSDAPRRRN